MERYTFLKWGQTAFDNFRVVPPGTGICHQVNLEYLSQTVWTDTTRTATMVAYPDTLVGTDSHTTMVNGLAVLGWGVGGIEAEAAMLGQPISMLIPEVVGFKLTGAMVEGTTATDLVLTRRRDAAREGRGRQVRRILRRRPGPPAAGRPRHHRQHGAGIRRDLRLLPDRRRNAALSAPDGPRRGPHRAGRGLCQGERHVARRRITRRSTPTRWSSTWAPSCRRSPARSARRTASRWTSPAALSATTSRASAPARTLDQRRGALGRRRRPARATGYPRRRRPSQSRLRADRGRALPAARRLDRDRRDHLLHQHLEPLRDDRRRSGGAQGRATRA